MAAPPMVIISCGRASRMTPSEPPEMMKPPNTMAKRTTMPTIWSMEGPECNCTRATGNDARPRWLSIGGGP